MARMLGVWSRPWCHVCCGPAGPDCPDVSCTKKTRRAREEREWHREVTDAAARPSGC